MIFKKLNILKKKKKF